MDHTLALRTMGVPDPQERPDAHTPAAEILAAQAAEIKSLRAAVAALTNERISEG